MQIYWLDSAVLMLLTSCCVRVGGREGDGVVRREGEEGGRGDPPGTHGGRPDPSGDGSPTCSVVF